MPANPTTSIPVLALLVGLAVLGGCAGRGLGDRAEAGPAPAAAVLPPRGGVFADDLGRLRSTDFVVRQQAAERLVGAGEPALAALGAAGDQRVRGLGGAAVSSTAPVVEAILGRLPPERVRAHLEGPWPGVRRAAADELGGRGVMGAVPALIARLEDEDEGVRRAAVASLRRLTQRYFGYLPTGRVLVRREAGARWEKWWRVEGRRRAERDRGLSG